MLVIVLVSWGLAGRDTGLGCAPVAGVAAHVGFAIGKLGVDLPGHHDHVAGSLFMMIVVAGEIPPDMAIDALDSKSGGIGRHRGPDLRRLQKLQILRRGVLLGTGSLGRLLSEERKK